MADSTAGNPPNAAALFDFDDPLPVPQMDSVYFSQDGEIMIDNLEFDLDFSIDDLDPNFLPMDPNSDPIGHHNCSDSEFYRIEGVAASQQELRSIGSRVFNSDPIGPHTCSDSEFYQFAGNQIEELSSTDSRVLNSDSSGAHQIYVDSPESNGSNKDSSGNQGVVDARVLDFPSPESQGSGNGFEENSVKIDVIDHDFNSKDVNSNVSDSSNNVLKRKKEDGESVRTSKCRKPIGISSTENKNSNITGAVSEEEEKRKARLVRNRESAQLSRQRKKHYVEELEGKVRAMHSTIQDLNAKISYVMAENASLRQQMMTSGHGVAQPVPMYPPVMYPWMPYAPPYMVKPQGSQLPLVPIPKLKPQNVVSETKVSKNVEGKKKMAKVKKVASVSFFGLLLFIFMFGVLAPMVNVRFGGLKEASMGTNFARDGFYKDYGNLSAANGPSSCVGFSHEKHFGDRFHCGEKEPHTNNGEVVSPSNVSNPIAASLYVPRNDKLVKIDGNLIIHSVLASEKAIASRGSAETKSSEETGLAIPGDLTPAIPARRHPHMYQGPAEHQRLTGADGKLQQWFQQGLSGPLLSSGMCTEVFQFDVSSAIVPATSGRNMSMEQPQNTTNSSLGKSRRILHSPIPISASPLNMSEENIGSNGYKESLNTNKTASPMVVSVLVDPREAGDADNESMMGTKSLSRIFVVVLIDSVKYVTYSCMLPFKGSVLL